VFANLLESRAPRQNVLGGNFLSGAMHVLLIWGAVVATANAGQRAREMLQQETRFIDVTKPKPPERAEERPRELPLASLAKGFRVLTAPLSIPDVIPAIDLTREVTRPEDFSGVGVPGGVPDGVRAIVPADPDQTYLDFAVEKPVVQAPGSATPRYPELLKAAGVEGTVFAEFVVDSTGRAEAASFRTLKSSHELFALAVRNALPAMRFIPAEIGGRKVKQLVRQTFVFAIQR
jgi:protein TonB